MDGHGHLQTEYSDDVVLIEDSDDDLLSSHVSDEQGDDVTPQKAFIAFYCQRGEVPFIHPCPIEDIRLNDVLSQSMSHKVNSSDSFSPLEAERGHKDEAIATNPIIITPFNVELEFSAYKGAISDEISENMISNKIWVICVELQNGLPVFYLHNPEAADHWPQCQLIVHSQEKQELSLCSIHVPKIVLDPYGGSLEALIRLILLPGASISKGLPGSDVMHSLGIATDSLPSSSSHSDVNLSHVCVECGDAFQYEDQLDRHIKWHIEDVYPCEICTEIFYTLDKLEAHTKQHSSIDFYPCEFCSKIYCNLLSLNEHYKTHIEYTCSLCGVQYSTLYGLRAHKKIHTSSMNCSMNTKGKLTEGNSHHHVLKKLLMHVKKYKCHLCSESFLSPYDLHWHMLRGHDMYMAEDDVTNDGNINSVSVTSAANEQIVVNRNFEEDIGARPLVLEPIQARKIKSQICQFCTKAYEKPYELKNHMLNRHQEELAGRPISTFIRYKRSGTGFTDNLAEMRRKVNCRICNKLVRKGYGMRSHMLTHVKKSKKSDEGSANVKDSMLYNCGICAATFKQYSQLQTHMQSHQTTQDNVVLT